MKKRMFKQWLSGVLAMCTVLSTCATSAFAAKTDSEYIRVVDSGAIQQEEVAPLETSLQLADGFEGGSGSEQNPYLISSEEELVWFAKEVNNGTSYEGKYIALEDDIALTEEWVPAGSSKTQAFSGSFDGCGHTISGMVIGSEELPSTLSNVGFFGYVGSTASIHNLDLSGVEIWSKPESAAMVGALVGTMNNGTEKQGAVLDHCTAEGSIYFTAGSGKNKNGNIGGLVGLLNAGGVLANSTANVQIDLSQEASAALNAGGLNAGGLIGFSGVKNAVINCAANGSIAADENVNNATMGGIAGIPAAVTYNSYFAGTLTGTESKLGGIGGKLSGKTVIRCSYPQGLEAFADASSVTIDKGTVAAKQPEEFSSDAFTQWLNNGLSTQERNTAKSKETLLDAMFSRVEGFYKWETAQDSPQMTDELWAAEEVDTDIFAGGSGTKQNPYQIETEAQLRAFAKSFTKQQNYENQYIALKNNIALSKEEWIPIGEGEYDFSGTFDGRGYTISGLTVGSSKNPKQDDADTRYFGLFGVLQNAVVKNLSLEIGIYVDGPSGIFTAGLAGYTYNTLVDGVHVSGTIHGTSGNSEAGNYWKANHIGGGLIGRQDKGAVVNCTSSVSIYSGARGGIAEAGGLVGLNNQGIIANSSSTGEISGNARREKAGDREYEGMPALGAIAGVNGGTIVQCYASGDLRADVYSYYVGEISGWVTGIGKVFSSYYNKEASQKIVDQVVNPAQHIGWMVSAGKNEDGTPYGGGTDYRNTGVTEKEAVSAAFAEKMNQGFSEFAVDLSDWGDPQLKKWELQGDVLIPSGEVASVTYVKPDIDDGQQSAPLYDGVFLGRNAEKTLIISMEVADGKIKAVTAQKNNYGTSLEKHLPLVVQANGTSALTGTDAASVALKGAVESAIKRAELDDTTGFGAADPSIFAGGNGTQGNPYKIATEDQLRAFAAAINVDESFSGKYVQVTSDIHLTKEWLPAGGNAPHRFKGTFDGNHKVISGLSMGTKDAPVQKRMSGLFAYLESATVKDVILKDVAIYATYSGSKRSYYGGLAAVIGAQGTTPCYINNVSVSGMIHVSSGYEIGYAGGIAAMLDTSIVANCVGNLDIEVHSPQRNHVYAGALIGAFARAAAVNNMAQGSVWAQSSLNHATAGGIAGLHASVSFNNTADVSLVSENPTAGVGGVMGRNTGIGEMMGSYFSSNSKQQQGSDVQSPNIGVGAVVTGSAAGFGKVIDVETYSDNTLLVQKLNQNLSNKTYLEETRRLLKLWNVSIPQDLRLFRWKMNGTSLAFDSSSSVLLAEASKSGGSSDSSHSSASNEAKSDSNKPELLAVKQSETKAVLEKAVGSESKSILTQVQATSEHATVSAKDLAGQSVYVYQLVNGVLQLQNKAAVPVNENGVAEIGAASAGRYVLIPAAEKPPVSDYVGTVKVPQGQTVPFHVTSGMVTDAGFAVGNGMISKTFVYQRFNGESAYYGLYANGKPGEKTGVYVNGIKMFDIEITAAPYRSDTTDTITSKTTGQTYWFKIMPNNPAAKVAYSAGDGKVLSTMSKGKQPDGSFLLGFKIIGKSGTQSGVYATIDGVSYSVFQVKVK